MRTRSCFSSGTVHFRHTHKDKARLSHSSRRFLSQKAGFETASNNLVETFISYSMKRKKEPVIKIRIFLVLFSVAFCRRDETRDDRETHELRDGKSVKLEDIENPNERYLRNKRGLVGDDDHASVVSYEYYDDYDSSEANKNKFLDLTNETVIKTNETIPATPNFETYNEMEGYCLKEFFEDYDPTLIPQKKKPKNDNDFTPAIVYLDFVLMQVIDISATENTMTFASAMAFMWEDHRFDFNKLDIWDQAYQNCSGTEEECKIKKPVDLSFRADEMWTPELILHNAAGEANDFAQKPYFMLYPDGYLFTLPPGLFTTSCILEMKLFPFDHQHCDIEFSSAVYNVDEIDFQIMDANSNKGRTNSSRLVQDRETGAHFKIECDTECNCQHEDRGKKVFINHQMGIPDGLNSEKLDPEKKSLPFGATVASLDCAAFQSNGEWDILDGKVSIRVKDNRQIIKYTIVLNRKPIFYIINIIVPIVLFSAISLFEFYLPSDSGEKMTLSISLTLGQVIFLFLVAMRIPRTSDTTPFLCKYLIFSMVLVIITSGVNLLICNIHFRSNSTHDINLKWKKFFMQVLGPKIGMIRPGQLPEITEDTVKRRDDDGGDKLLMQQLTENKKTTSFSSGKDKFGKRTAGGDKKVITVHESCENIRK